MNDDVVAAENGLGDVTPVRAAENLNFIIRAADVQSATVDQYFFFHLLRPIGSTPGPPGRITNLLKYFFVSKIQANTRTSSEGSKPTKNQGAPRLRRPVLRVLK